ncbi:aldehyde dehydrogenase family protein [Streptomyces sp. NPDC008317]|uniref:aldehyde dehydrogenase family protein n=1 Tax=Streptomyces sp. NPDC008317 TaxID=3364827 RepID=UPI0036EB305B
MTDSMDVLEIQSLVGGRWTGAPTAVRDNPAVPGQRVSLSADLDAATVERALDAAHAAARDWGRTPAPARGRILERAAALLDDRADEAARDITREEGKTLAEARGEVARAADILRFHGSEGWRIGGTTYPSAAGTDLVYSRREPLGAVAVITPWNFPIAIPAWKSAPALVSGNAVVLKPAQIAPAGAWHLARVLQEAGLPDGVFTLLTGSGARIGAQLVASPRIDAVTFTGSVGVGAGIYTAAAPRRIRVQLELGGKNAVVVCDDADAAVAARIVAAGGFGLTGQACTATSRVICLPGVKDAFLDALREEAAAYRPGDGLTDGVRMGPVVSGAQLATDLGYVDKALAEGARTVVGGAAPDGLLLGPTVLTGVRPADTVAQEEVFGPVVAVLDATGLDQAIDLVNDSRFGLTAGVVTNDLDTVHRFSSEVRAGVIKVNRPTSGVELNVPFGGVGDSSTNTYREQGQTAVDFFTWTKSVYQASAPGSAS